MERYGVAPAWPVCLYSAGPGDHLRPGAPCGGSARRSGGAEIGIFTAERYFSAADVVVCRLHDAVPRPARPADHHHELQPPVVASDVASQSGRTSEASWNSRSRLLPGGHPAAVIRMKGSGGAVDAGGHRHGGGNKKPTSSSAGQWWTLFRRDCPCAGRKAVTVDVASSEPAVEECLHGAIFNKAKTPFPPRLLPVTSEEPAAKVKVTVTSGSRAFPLATTDVLAVAAAPDRGAAGPFGAAIGRRAGGFTFPDAARLMDEPPRASLEVFRPIDDEDSSAVLADPHPAEPRRASSSSRGRDLVLRAPPAVPPAAVDEEETMSDASSDLFDLESFAALSSSYPTTYHRGRNSSDGDDDLLPYPYAALAEPSSLGAECRVYAPSEASVVWSVATAEVDASSTANYGNFSSAASACGGDVDEFRFVVPEPPAEFAAAGRMKTGGGGFLNSCRCEKAVSVGPTPVRMVRRPPAYPSAGAKKGSGSAARCHPGRVVHVPPVIRT